MNTKIFIIIFLLISINIFGQTVPLPTDFPTALPSARIKGLGNSGTAVPGFASPFYNPALCALIPSTNIHLSFANEEHSSLAQLIDNEPSITGKHIAFFSLTSYQGGFAFHPLYNVSYSDSIFGDDNIIRDLDVTLSEYILTLTTYSGASQQFEVPFFMGVNIKYLRGHFAETKIYYSSATTLDSADADISTGNGYGLDIGIAYLAGDFIFGLSAKDIFTHIYWSGDYEKQIIPFSSSFGITYSPISGALLLTLDIDRILQKDKPFIYTAGIEYNILRDYNNESFLSKISSGSIAFRGGALIKKFYGLELTNLTCGLGYNINGIIFDMAVEGVPDNYRNGNLSYQLSLTMPITL